MSGSSFIFMCLEIILEEKERGSPVEIKCTIIRFDPEFYNVRVHSRSGPSSRHKMTKNEQSIK